MWQKNGTKIRKRKQFESKSSFHDNNNINGHKSDNFFLGNYDVGLIIHSDIYRGIRTSYTNKTIITNE